MHQKGARASLVFEIPEAQGQLAKIFGRDRTAGMPGSAAYSAQERCRYWAVVEYRRLGSCERKTNDQGAGQKPNATQYLWGQRFRAAAELPLGVARDKTDSDSCVSGL